MLNIPYVKSPDENACALASYTMVAKYFFPATTLEEVAKVSNWEPGYVVWAFKFWLWIMDKGVKVTEYDLVDYRAWADKGIKGLEESVSKKEFEFYKNHTKDLESYSQDIRRVLEHENFVHVKANPQFSDLEKAYQSGGICEIVLDSSTLEDEEDFSLHRVVILDVAEDAVVFHDPQEEPMPARQVSRALFQKSWLEEVSEPELCIYKI